MRRVRGRIGSRELEVEIAETAWERMRGLIGRSALPSGRALWILRCNSVHMLGVRVPLDLVWLDREGRVMRVDRGVRPGLRVRGCLGASSVLEMAAGTAGGLREGERLELGEACRS